jgi:hypothetical protein
MTMPLPRYASPSANTDDHGFRIAIKGGRRIVLDRIRSASVAKGIVLGNGQVWGTGTTADDRVIHNVLNALRPAEFWYSLALKGTNLTQERLAAELFAPLDAAHAVWITGSHFLNGTFGNRPHYPLLPFPTQSPFYAALGGAHLEPVEQPDPKTRWPDVLMQFDREMTLFARTFKSGRSAPIFALQPSLYWSRKPHAVQERELQILFSAESGLTARHEEAMRALAMAFVAQAGEICARHGVRFVNLSDEPELMPGNWLFLDGGHLTDAGHAAMATAVARHLG